MLRLLTGLLPLLIPALACPALSRAESVIPGLLTRIEKTHPARELDWNWEDAILLHSLARVAEDTQDPALRARLVHFLRDFSATWSVRSLPEINRGDRCPAVLAELAVSHFDDTPPHPALLEPVRHYLKTATRNRLGALDHLGSSWYRAIFPESIWIDSLVMTGLTSVRLGLATGDSELVDWGARQPTIYAQVLLDPNDHLFRHAWLVGWERTLPKSPTYWLRGNAWVIWSLVEMLEVLPPSHPSREGLQALLSEVSAALLRLQGPSGLWDSVANLRDYAGDETSGSAIIAAHWLRAVRRGFLPPEPYLTAAKATWRGIAPRLERQEDGSLSVRGISGPTNPGPRTFYRWVPEKRDASYGLGPVLILASEIEALL